MMLLLQIKVVRRSLEEQFCEAQCSGACSSYALRFNLSSTDVSEKVPVCVASDENSGFEPFISDAVVSLVGTVVTHVSQCDVSNNTVSCSFSLALHLSEDHL